MSRSGRDRTALLVVDVQPDFLPGGTLAVAEGDAILAGIAELMTSDRFAVCVATQDWHPPDHVSFASNHAGRAPLDTIELHGHEQVLWPDHCVQGTPGAELARDLPWERVEAVIRKGTQSTSDSYSGFRNNWNPDGKRPATGLAGYLRERGIDTVVLCGLARDYCVKWSAEDAVDEGFESVVLWDLTRPVDPGSNARVREELVTKRVAVIESTDLSQNR